MSTFPCIKQADHLFIEVDGRRYLLDTGAPFSFGSPQSLCLEGKSFDLASSYQGLTLEELQRFVGVDCSGLLGADMLAELDWILDATAGILKVSGDQLQLDGSTIELDFFMGIPIVNARLGGDSLRVFLDTGAQVSYLQIADLQRFPYAGCFDDFYPGLGTFKTETYSVDLHLGNEVFQLRCGKLPSQLGAALMMAQTRGIIGQELFLGRVIGYFPRRKLLVLG